MKIGILTFHCAANYGAVLQAYALQETLKSLGHISYIIDYKPEFLTKPYNPFNLCKWSLKKRIHSILTISIRISRFKKFKSFIKNNLNLLSFKEIKNLDAIIVGSDQIWSSIINNGNFDNTYFLNFKLPHNIKKISYAASVGDIESFKKNLHEEQINYLHKFDSISVREENLSLELKKCLNISLEPQVVLDPVLLIGKDYFLQFIDRRLVPKQRYVLSFTLNYNKNVSDYARQYAQTHHFKIIDMFSMDESFRNDTVETASINKFLSLIFYSEAIYTTSFHGMAFSINFNKPFIFFGKDMIHAERSINILRSLDIENAFFLLNKNFQNSIDPPKINYQKVNTELEKRRLNSLRFLESSLKEF